MRFLRTTAGLFGILGLASAWIFYELFVVHIYGLGFPDGYISDFDNAQRSLFILCNWESIIFSAVLFFLCRKGKNERIAKQLSMALIFQILFLIVIFAIDYLLYIRLDHGQGG